MKAENIEPVIVPTPRVVEGTGLKEVLIWFALMFFVGIPLGILLMGGSVAIVRNLDRQEASK